MGDMMTDAQYQAAIQDRSNKVKTLRAQHKAMEAVVLALQNPPIYSKDDRIKQANADVVNAAMHGCTKSEIKAVLENLTTEAEDTLMKYIYRGLAQPQNNGALLEWHAQAAAKAGDGCIIRALVDRKTV